MLEIQQREGAVILSVRVQPRASKDELAGEMNGVLKIKIASSGGREPCQRRLD
jgi:uncharacterized protein YggU (UPF0235/DUF167 family)